MDSFARWTGIILVVLALARAAVLVAHGPAPAYPGAAEPTAACCAWNAEGALASFVSSVMRAVRPSEHFPLRAIGIAKLVLLFATAFAVAALLMDRPAASALHGLVVLFVLADPYVTLWASSLHRELIEIWAIYTIVCGACLIAATERDVVPWSLLFAGVMVLAFTRQHEALLGLALVLLAWPWLWHRSQRLAAGASVLAAALAVAAVALLPHEGAMHVPSFDAIGATWVKSIAQMQHAGPTHADLPPWSFSLLEPAVLGMPAALFAVLQAATLLLLPLALLALLVLRRWRGDPLAPLLVAASLGAIALHAAAVAMFAGAPDPGVRYVPAILAMLAAIIAVLVGVPVLVRRWIAEWRDMPLELGVGVAAVSLGVYAVVLVIPA
jgi:hypothetical protein